MEESRSVIFTLSNIAGHVARPEIVDWVDALDIVESKSWRTICAEKKPYKKLEEESLADAITLAEGMFALDVLTRTLHSPKPVTQKISQDSPTLSTPTDRSEESGASQATALHVDSDLEQIKEKMKAEKEARRYVPSQDSKDVCETHLRRLYENRGDSAETIEQNIQTISTAVSQAIHTGSLPQRIPQPAQTAPKPPEPEATDRGLRLVNPAALPPNKRAR